MKIKFHVWELFVKSEFFNCYRNLTEIISFPKFFLVEEEMSLPAELFAFAIFQLQRHQIFSQTQKNDLSLLLIIRGKLPRNSIIFCDFYEDTQTFWVLVAYETEGWADAFCCNMCDQWHGSICRQILVGDMLLHISFFLSWQTIGNILSFLGVTISRHDYELVFSLECQWFLSPLLLRARQGFEQ